MNSARYLQGEHGNRCTKSAKVAPQASQSVPLAPAALRRGAGELERADFCVYGSTP